MSSREEIRAERQTKYLEKDTKYRNVLVREASECLFHYIYSFKDFGFANIFMPDSKLQTFCGSPP